jgi:cytosine/adenosine deaminase-related metal-dependent hydrolase
LAINGGKIVGVVPTADAAAHLYLTINCTFTHTLQHYHSLAINGGKIVGVVPTADAAALFHARETLDRSTHILMPGLVNAHTHAGMTALKGYADDTALIPWLTQSIFPAEAQFVSEVSRALGSGYTMANAAFEYVVLFLCVYVLCVFRCVLNTYIPACTRNTRAHFCNDETFYHQDH